MDVNLFFPSAVARSSHPEFLEPARAVLTEYLARVKPNAWNVCQSESMMDDRLEGLLNKIAQSSYEMLAEQGYDMKFAQTNVTEFWGQEFARNGQHIEHIHPRGVQVTGFYFVDVPANSSMPAIFDPRPGKRQINLPQANMEEVSYASEQIFFGVQPGDLMLFNSWLGHGFTRHESDTPFRFIHFNVTVEDFNVCRPMPPKAEVI